MGLIHLTPKELAERLHLSTSTLANWRVDGKGPRFIGRGSRILYPITEVEDWEKRNLRSSTSGVTTP